MKQRHYKPLKFRVRALSLIELMIALVLSLAVLGLIINIFFSTRSQNQTHEALSRIQENARQAMQYLQEDIRMSGFMGDVYQYWLIQETGTSSRKLGPLTDECFTHNGSARPYRWAAPMIAVDNSRVPPKILGKDGSNTDFTGCIPDANYQSNTDILSLHFAENSRIDNADLGGQAFYLRSNLSGGAVFACNNGMGTVSGTACLASAVGGGALPANLTLYTPGSNLDPTRETANFQIQAYVYFVQACSDPGSDGRCDSRDDQTPTLMRGRIEYDTSKCRGNNPCVVFDPIAEGVVSMQVEYGIDTPDGSGNYDGYVDRYVRARDIVGGDMFSDSAMAQWNHVLTVRVWLLIRSENREGNYLDPHAPYDLGGQSVEVDAGYRHQVYTTTIALRNFKG